MGRHIYGSYTVFGISPSWNGRIAAKTTFVGQTLSVPNFLCLPCTHAQACVVKQVDTSKLSTKDRLHVRSPFFAFVSLSCQRVWSRSFIHSMLCPIIQAFVLSNNVTVKSVTEQNGHFTFVWMGERKLVSILLSKISIWLYLWRSHPPPPTDVWGRQAVLCLETSSVWG